MLLLYLDHALSSTSKLATLNFCAMCSVASRKKLFVRLIPSHKETFMKNTAWNLEADKISFIIFLLLSGVLKWNFNVKDTRQFGIVSNFYL